MYIALDGLPFFALMEKNRVVVVAADSWKRYAREVARRDRRAMTTCMF